MRGYSPAQAEICRVSVSNKANIPIHRANTLHSCSCDPQTSCCELVQELRAELARKDKVVENLTKRCKTHEEASQRQLSSGRSEGTLQQFAERCAQQILAAAQKRRSCSAEEIIDYRGAAYQQELEADIPDFSGFRHATLLATLANSTNGQTRRRCIEDHSDPGVLLDGQVCYVGVSAPPSCSRYLVYADKNKRRPAHGYIQP